MPARIVDLELHRQGARRGVEDARVVDVMRLQRHGSATAGDFEREPVDIPARAASAAGTCARSSTRSVRTILNSGAPSSYEAPSVADHVRDAAGDRRAQDERVAGRGAAAGAQCFVALRQPRLGGLQPRFGDRDGAPRLLDAACGDRTFGQQPLRARLFGARGLGRGLASATSAASVARSSPLQTRLEASECLARARPWRRPAAGHRP